MELRLPRKFNNGAPICALLHLTNYGQICVGDDNGQMRFSDQEEGHLYAKNELELKFTQKVCVKFLSKKQEHMRPVSSLLQLNEHTLVSAHYCDRTIIIWSNRSSSNNLFEFVDELKGPLDSDWVNRLVEINNFDNNRLLSFASCSNDNKIIIWKQQQSTALKFE